ncbi:RNA binding [Hirschfeldia incana]|nr:RNA binding [Hirschfeldia incana]
MDQFYGKPSVSLSRELLRSIFPSLSITMSDYGDKTCPLCAEEMDLTDQQLNPCQCGYQICVWCWHHIMDMAEKDQSEGRCPACRTPYDKEKIVGMTVDRERLNSEGNMDRKKTHKSKLKPSEGRKQLASVRVVQRNLVYIVGLPLDLADEDILQRKDYFGQYGKVLKVSMSRTATGLIQQFPNNTCSVYITYAKEEEAVRCIQSVHGFILDGKGLKACFGTTKYCHAWLRNAACNNPDCLYLHEVGSQEDSFTKDEVIPAHTRVQQITGALNTLQTRSGSVLPPPLDAYSNDSSTAKPIAKVPSTTAAASSPKSSPPSGSSVRSTALPAAASWGARVTNQKSLATSTASNGSFDNHRSTSENGTLAMPTANANSHVSNSTNTLQKPPHKEESRTLAQKSKPGMLKPSQNNIGVDPGSKRTVSPNRDPSSNQVSCIVESSFDSRVVEEPSAVENSFASTNEVAEDVPNVSNLADEVAWMGITTNTKDEDPGVPVAIGAYCDQGSIRQPGNNVPDLEQCSTNTGAEADVSQNRIPGSSGEWDWRSDLQSQVQVNSVNSALQVDGLSSVNSSRGDVAEGVSHSTYRCSSSSSILDLVHTASRSFQTRETSGGFGSSFEIGSDRVHHPNGFSETSRSRSSMQHSLFANAEGRNNIQSAENDIISNILDFDPWDESLTMPPNFAKLLGQSDQWGSTLEQSNLLKQRNDQSRFSFARHEESNNQAYDNNSNNTYSIYGQLSRGQPVQEFGVNRDIYQDKFGSQNGFASNYSGGYEQFAASPGFSSYKSPAVRSQVPSAPPGFSSPSKLPPPGFSSHERANMSSDFISGTRLLEPSSVLRNAYHIPPPSSNLNTAGDVEFIDPAILAVGRGRIQNAMENGADFDMRSGFYSQLSSFEKDARLHQLLAQQRSQAAQQQQQEVNVNNFTPSVSDHYFLLNNQWP